MSRVARVVAPGYPHHVTQRGNRRADVFGVDADREAYLRFLQNYARRHGLEVWAYCLMTNHVHLVVVPEREESLGQGLRDAHTVYAMYFNSRLSLSGHLWQGRFYSTPMDGAHLWAAVRYVEQNPVRAGLVDRAEAYRWSSAAAHCGLRQDPVLTGAFPEPGIIEDWAAWLSGAEDPDCVENIRRHTHTGRPCGSGEFLSELEIVLRHDLRSNRRGRKPRKRAQMENSGVVGRSNS